MRTYLLYSILMILILAGSACGLQPAENSPETTATVSSPAAAQPNNETTLLLWEGPALFAENPTVCHRLRLTTDDQALLGRCDGEQTQVEFIANRDRGLAEMISRFAPFQSNMPDGRVIFNGRGEITGPAWERAITNWASFTYAELASGRVGAAARTVLAWDLGELADQPNQCQMLIVLGHGYATTGLTPCEGGQIQVLASGWIDSPDWEQFDTWLYGRAPLYQDNSYLDGRGTTEMSPEEAAALDEWAKVVYTSLSQTGDSGADIPAALNLRQILAQQLHVDVGSVQIANVEEVVWPDACLGAPYADQLCAPKETPGYKIMLAFNHNQYSYHTDRDGQQIRLVDAPEPAIGERVLTWFGSDDSGCQTVEVGADGVAFGRCGRSLMGVPFSFNTRQPDLAEFAGKYTSFEAETMAGTINFTGNGTNLATPAEQRMLAEWARLVYQEAESGRSGASWGLVFAQHREGGLAGFCDDVTVYLTGDTYVSSCKGDQPVDLGRMRLTAGQLATVYNWVDTLQPFEQEAKDPAIADGMTTQLVFSGAGDQPAQESDIMFILELAQTLYNEATMQTMSLPEMCLTPEANQQLLLHEAHGYCLLYPAHYSLIQTTPDSMELVIDTVMNHIDPRLSIGVEVAAGRNLEEVARQLEADYAPGFDVTQYNIIVDGVEAIMLDNLPGQDLNRRVAFIQNERLYHLFFGPIGEEGSQTRQKAETLYQQVLDTFRFLEAPVSSSTPAPEGEEVGSSDTAYIMAAADLNIRSGPGTQYDVVGSVFGGQIARVTGVTPDGQWWRVICPDDTVGNCFVIADPTLAQPTTAP